MNIKQVQHIKIYKSKKEFTNIKICFSKEKHCYFFINEKDKYKNKLQKGIDKQILWVYT